MRTGATDATDATGATLGDDAGSEVHADVDADASGEVATTSGMAAGAEPASGERDHFITTAAVSPAPMRSAMPPIAQMLGVLTGSAGRAAVPEGVPSGPVRVEPGAERASEE